MQTVLQFKIHWENEKKKKKKEKKKEINEHNHQIRHIIKQAK